MTVRHDPVGSLLDRLLFTGTEPLRGRVTVSPRQPVAYVASYAHDVVAGAEAWWFRTTKCQWAVKGTVCADWRWHRGLHSC